MSIPAEKADIYWYRYSTDARFDTYVCCSDERLEQSGPNEEVHDGVNLKDYMNSYGSHVVGWCDEDSVDYSSPEMIFVSIISDYEKNITWDEFLAVVSEFAKINECSWAVDILSCVALDGGRRVDNSSMFADEFRNKANGVGFDEIREIVERYARLPACGWARDMKTYFEALDRDLRGE
uniref:hypothetical protein n=1 Tax=Stappia sp. TaxID=1870903 RepID=UPI003BAC54B6